MLRIAVIQFEAVSPIGYLAEAAQRHEAEIKTAEMWNGGRLPSDHEHYDGLIVLGGSMNAEDDENFPYLRRTANLIRHFHRNRKPVLGICLGAQLTARAFGAPVHANRFGEIGFTTLASTPAAAEDPLLRAVGGEIHAIQYHADSFDLPAEATALLTGTQCPNQAFRIGQTSYAFQAHIEATPDRMRQWLESMRETLAKTHPGLPERFEHDSALYAEKAHASATLIGDAWFGLAAQLNRRGALDAGFNYESYY